MQVFMTPNKSWGGGAERKPDRFFRFPVYGFIIARNTFYVSKCNRKGDNRGPMMNFSILFSTP